MTDFSQSVIHVRNGQGGAGGGVFIAADLVLTAAHMVSTMGGPVPAGLKLPISVSVDGITEIPVSVVGYNQITTIPNLQPTASMRDFALLKLATPIADRPVMGFDVDCIGGRGTISGFPGGAQDVQNVPTALLYLDDPTPNPPYKAWKTTFSADGTSGGPVWLDGKIVGIYSSASTGNDYGIAGAVTLATMQQIEDWLATLGRCPAIARLYWTLLNRAPDSDGLKYWSDRIVQFGREAVFNEIVKAFIASPEFQTDYAGLKPANIIAEIYQRALNRAPDSDGLAYWLGMPIVWAIVGITQSAEAMTYGSQFSI